MNIETKMGIGLGLGAAVLLKAVSTLWYHAGRMEGEARTITIMKENNLTAGEIETILRDGSDGWSKGVCKILNIYESNK